MSFFEKLKPLELPVKYYELLPADRFIVREMYIKQQAGLCCHCHYDLRGKPPPEILEKKVTPKLYPYGFFNNPVHLHHNHDTGLTIGVVHAYCNAVLWEHYDE